MTMEKRVEALAGRIRDAVQHGRSLELTPDDLHLIVGALALAAKRKAGA